MKLQDTLFFAVLIIILFFDKKFSRSAGLICFALAGLLFLVQNLFTAQRLSWYASGFLLLYCIKHGFELMVSGEKHNENRSEKKGEK